MESMTPRAKQFVMKATKKHRMSAKKKHASPAASVAMIPSMRPSSRSAALDAAVAAGIHLAPGPVPQLERPESTSASSASTESGW